MMRVSRRTIYKLLHDGRLGSTKVGERRLVLYRSIVDLIDGNTTEARAP
jgi:excisionase family DNA binding protein